MMNAGFRAGRAEALFSLRMIAVRDCKLNLGERETLSKM
jgi:hypothetical protein